LKFNEFLKAVKLPHQFNALIKHVNVLTN